MRDAFDLLDVFKIAGGPADRVLRYLKQNAILGEAVGRAGIPVTAASLAAEINMDKSKFDPDITPSEVHEAILFLVREGFLGQVPNRKDDTCEFRLTVPLSARERKRRSRFLRRLQGFKAVTIYLPEGASPEETAQREAELRAYIESRWGKQPDLF